jgi:hypothetical protein
MKEGKRRKERETVPKCSEKRKKEETMKRKRKSPFLPRSPSPFTHSHDLMLNSLILTLPTLLPPTYIHPPFTFDPPTYQLTFTLSISKLRLPPLPPTFTTDATDPPVITMIEFEYEREKEEEEEE